MYSTQAQSKEFFAQQQRSGRDFAHTLPSEDSEMLARSNRPAPARPAIGGL